MGDPSHSIQIEGSSSSQTTSASVNTTLSLPLFFGMLKYIVCFPPLLFVLSLATSTINILIYTSLLFEWLAFFLLLSSILISSAHSVTLFIFFIERYLVKKNNKVFYFVFALRTSAKYFFSSASILLSWIVLIKPHMTSHFVFHFITCTLATAVIITVLWMLNIVIFKGLDCRCHHKNFFKNIQDFISEEYVLQTLSGVSRGSRESEDNNTRTRFKWIKRAFHNYMHTGLHTICDEVGKSNLDNDLVVENVNMTNNEIRDIQESDLLLVMEKEAVEDFLRFFDGATETRRISQESRKNYRVKVCNGRKHLVKLLNSRSKVIVQLRTHALVIQALSAALALVWILLMSVETTTKSLVFSLPVLVLGYYCKIIIDGAMLAIVQHPFDKGDHCSIDNEKLVVKSTGLINTTFLKENGTELKLQNSVLQNKFIGNLCRRTELTDNFEIHVSSTTSSDKIQALRLKIDEFIKSKPGNWRAVYCFNDIGMDDVKHIYNLEITDIRKFENYQVNKDRRSELILKLRQFLQELDIKNVTIK